MSLIVGPYYRGDPRIKPNQWGNFSAVQSALFHNLERMGIDPRTCQIAMPMWNPGDQRDYSKKGFVSANNGTDYRQNSLFFESSLYLDTYNHLYTLMHYF